MLSEHAVIFNPDDVVGVIWVVFFEMEQDFQLHTGLMLELLFVPDDLNSHYFSGFMINTLQCLSKRSFS